MIDSDANEKVTGRQREVERAQLRAWMSLSSEQKIDVFEEMVELAYQSGALTPERLARRDMRVDSEQR